MLQEYEIWSIKAKKPRVKPEIFSFIILALHLYAVLLFEFRTAEQYVN
jgi:hypothetical protein